MRRRTRSGGSTTLSASGSFDGLGGRAWFQAGSKGNGSQPTLSRGKVRNDLLGTRSGISSRYCGAINHSTQAATMFSVSLPRRSRRTPVPLPRTACWAEPVGGRDAAPSAPSDSTAEIRASSRARSLLGASPASPVSARRAGPPGWRACSRSTGRPTRRSRRLARRCGWC